MLSFLKITNGNTQIPFVILKKRVEEGPIFSVAWKQWNLKSNFSFFFFYIYRSKMYVIFIWKKNDHDNFKVSRKLKMVKSRSKRKSIIWSWLIAIGSCSLNANKIWVSISFIKYWIWINNFHGIKLIPFKEKPLPLFDFVENNIFNKFW